MLRASGLLSILSDKQIVIGNVHEDGPMPKGSKDWKRPRDPSSAMSLMAGEGQADFPADDGKDKAAQSLGQRGGRARAKALSPKRRKEIARQGAAARWKT
jgi:hypothetical protein